MNESSKINRLCHQLSKFNKRRKTVAVLTIQFTLLHISLKVHFPIVTKNKKRKYCELHLSFLTH
jgi:hypothetical protein